ncbi:MAG: hypothetical protein JXR87_09815 [Candidatus Marinimicrobia bacterium]|nr:hypothetical protein [Candidatus Neomarinimicrobiota bacterium]
MDVKLPFLITLIFFCLCHPGKQIPESPINLDHALNLVDSVKVGNEQLYFIYIYADAPSYKPITAIDEGITCVDDVGRFMEVLETEICQYNRKDLLPIALGMARFLVYMSRDDGLWYNFIHANGSINTSYRTSVAEFQWWAVRGLRGLAAVYSILQQYPDDELKKVIVSRIHSMDSHLDSVLASYPQCTVTEWGQRPTWLIKNAPDINSELLFVLIKLHGQADFNYEDEIRKVADGLVEFQYNNPDSPLDGMYFCWQNLWHNWGNNQSTALLEAYRITKDEKYLSSVKKWADHFIPFLLDNRMLWEITIAADGSYQATEFPQIAYGIHALYSGMKSLADLTKNDIYIQQAERIFAWFEGENVAKMTMYEKTTGRCYDGINSASEVNLNSGAESTIECLLAIQKRGKF